MDPPRQIGPCQFEPFAGWIAVRCPREYDRLCEMAGGAWEPGSRRWLIVPRRIGPLLAQLVSQTDPLFRWGGVDCDAPRIVASGPSLGVTLENADFEESRNR